jgi:hypothetical protein
MEAADFLVKLKTQGRLPGFPKDEHATTQMMIQNLSQDSHGVWQFSAISTENIQSLEHSMRVKIMMVILCIFTQS